MSHPMCPYCRFEESNFCDKGRGGGCQIFQPKIREVKFDICPICGREVKVRGGVEDWKPTFYDPDSGGDPYYIHCECGLEFSIGYCEITDLAKAWNRRARQ